MTTHDKSDKDSKISERLYRGCLIELWNTEWEGEMWRAVHGVRELHNERGGAYFAELADAVDAIDEHVEMEAARKERRRKAEHKIAADNAEPGAGEPILPRIGKTLNEIRQINNERNVWIHKREGVPLGSWPLSEWSNAMAGECGEACNVVKKIRRLRDGMYGVNAKADQKEEKLFRELGWELADTFLYIDLLATAAGIDLEKAVIEKFNIKSEDMKAPHRMG